MKGHKGHHHKRNTGGVNEAAEDLKSKPEEYNHSRVEEQAEEKKRGGRARKKHEGEHHEVHGEHAKKHAGRKPRKSGGGANATDNPFSSARKGEAPKGRKLDLEMD